MAALITAVAAGKIQLRLTDITGKTVISLKQNISAETNQLTITVPGTSQAEIIFLKYLKKNQVAKRCIK